MAKLPSEEYNPKFASCRDLGHEWDYYQWHGSKRTLICDACGARREEVMDGNMKIVWRRYRMPKGYYWKDVALPIKKIRAQLKREARKLTRWVGPGQRHGGESHLKVVK